MSLKTLDVDDGNYHYVLKIAIVGDPGVGKSMVVRAQTTGQAGTHETAVISKDQVAATGIRFEKQQMERNGKIFRIEYWDSPGAERYMKLTGHFCSGAAAVVFVYDVNDKLTLEHIDDWITAIGSHGQPALVLLANKIDQPALRRQVSAEQGEAVAKKYHMHHAEISAFENIGVEESFKELFDRIIEKIPVPPEPSLLLKSNIRLGKLLAEDSAYRNSLFTGKYPTGGLEDTGKLTRESIDQSESE